MAKPPITPLPFKEQFEIALGRMIIRLSNLEFSIMSAISILTKLEVDTAINLLAGEHLPTLIKMLDSAFPYAIKDRKKELGDEALREFAAIVKRLDNVNTKRNYYVHRMWFLEDNPIAQTLRAIRGQKGKTVIWDEQKITLNELSGLVVEINDVDRDLANCFIRHELIVPKMADTKQ